MAEKIIIANKVYDVKEAAELLGATPLTISEYCREGKIKSQKIGEWKILGQSLIDFLQGKDDTTQKVIGTNEKPRKLSSS